MSDPSIQTFCCHKPGTRTASVSLLSEFNSTNYNVVCLVSSILGCSGALYQLLPRRELRTSRRWFSLTSARGQQIVIWLAIADFLASLGVLMRSTVKLNDSLDAEEDSEQTIILCLMLAAWIQYFYMATWSWTLFYAVDTWLALKKKPGKPKLYHAVAWILPACFTFIGLMILYFPNADCHNFESEAETFLKLLPNQLFIDSTILTVMVACPALFMLSARTIDDIIASCLGQVTNKERSIARSIRMRFAFIILTFYLCWLPNIINGIVIWSVWYELPRTFVLIIVYAIAVLNPLQAFFNSFVYRRTHTKIMFPFSLEPPNERTPLVQSKS